jgi:hypothetical protein
VKVCFRSVFSSLANTRTYQYLTDFETLVSEIERNFLKALKVVAMSELKSRFFQLLSE